MNDMITGKSKTIWLLGNPVAHSISPQIHNHALQKLGLPFVYVPMQADSHLLSSAVHLLRSDSVAGANVTLPHKRGAIHYCDKISQLSEKTATVNTIYKKDGLICGTTTDSHGFLRALSYNGHDPQRDHVVILGNGGTARTLACALALQNRSKTISLAGRSHQRAVSLADTITAQTGVAVGGYDLNGSQFKDVMQCCTLLVNCTSVGMHPDIHSSPLRRELLHKEMTVFDCVYNPVETRLLNDAANAGCKTINGLYMLLFQALESFKLWTGVSAPENIYDIEDLKKLVQKRETVK